jgi:hypothetical protein
VALPLPEEVAAEIVENLETALERFRRVAGALSRPWRFPREQNYLAPAIK